MKPLNKYIFFIAVTAALAACGSTDRYKQNSVWDLYDVRTPVPANSGVISRATQYDPGNAGYNSPNVGSVPIDNDAFYIPPTGYVP